MQGIPYSDPVRVYILAYEDSRFAIICGMVTAAFDTLQAARTLQNAGFDQPKAEALAELMRQRDIDYATRADIARLESAINQLRNWFASGLVTILVAVLATAFLPG